MHNLSQVLLRNTHLLSAQTPLLVNLPADNFMHEYLSLYPDSKLSYFTTNFEQYQAINQQKPAQVNCTFSAYYRSEQKHDLAIISFPKSKAELTFTLAMLSDSLTNNATIIIVGENKSGIKSVTKLSQDYIQHCGKADSARHCSLFSGQYMHPKKAFNLDDWYKYYQFDINGVSLKVASLPGVFSQKNLDIGTRVLLENLPNTLSGEKILDFGCGAGVIASFVHKQNPHCKPTLVDVSALALLSAEKTLALNSINNAELLPSNSLSAVTGKFDHVISNPPFHQGVKTNYIASESFLANIKKHLLPKGTLTVVANSFLRYQPLMEKAIATPKTLIQNKGFSVYHCVVK